MPKKMPVKRVTKKVRKKGKPKSIGVGPGKSYPEELRDKKALQTLYIQKRRSKESFRRLHEISVDFDTSTIRWDVRLACKYDLQKFGEEYFPSVTYLPPADYHIDIIKKLQLAFLGTHKSAIGVPRGGGKDSWLNIALMWGSAYAHKLMPFLIGSTETSALETLDFIKKNWFTSDKLRYDFPEIGYPIFRTGNNHFGAKGQTFNCYNTDLVWAAQDVQYGNLLLLEDQAKPFLDNDPDILSYLGMREFRNLEGDKYKAPAWFPRSGGIAIQVTGIDGQIRGRTFTHPVTLELRRPDIVVLNDIQKDQNATSPTICDKLVKRIDGAVGGLGGPDKDISAIMLATVIEEDDVSDRYLSRDKKPDWSPERHPMVRQWPEGITNYDIDVATEAGKHWTKYGELRVDSMKQYDDIRLATQYYQGHREEMDKGFIISWEARYSKKGGEISAIQSAMNKKFHSPLTFPSEYQNAPRRSEYLNFAPIVRGRQLAEKTTQLPKGYAPLDTTHVVVGIDPGDEYLQYMVLACDMYYSGAFIEWGTFPEEPMRHRYWRKNQAAGWRYLSKRFLEANPEQFAHADLLDKSKRKYAKIGKFSAPIEAKIYWGLGKLCDYLLKKVYPKFESATPQDLRVSRICIDSGAFTEVVRRFIRDRADPRIISSQGLAPKPSQRQFEEYERRKGWIFEDMTSPGTKEIKWYYAPSPSDNMYEMRIDVDRMKSFLFQRLHQPIGTTGSIYLYNDTPENHEMICDQICESEYPEPDTQRGKTKDLWKSRNQFDNEGLDTAVLCLAMASMCGSRLKIQEQDESNLNSKRKKRKSLSKIWEEKRGRKAS